MEDLSPFPTVQPDTTDTPVEAMKLHMREREKKQETAQKTPICKCLLIFYSYSTHVLIKDKKF
jgi:hypothetical protein